VWQYCTVHDRYTDSIGIHNEQQKYSPYEKTHNVGISMENFGVVWAIPWDSHRFYRGYGILKYLNSIRTADILLPSSASDVSIYSGYLRYYSIIRPLSTLMKCRYSVAPTLKGTVARPPPFYKWLGTGAPWVKEQQIINWPNCTDHHKSAHQNDQLYFYNQKSGGARPKKFPALVSPTFKFVPASLPLFVLQCSDTS